MRIYGIRKPPVALQDFLDNFVFRTTVSRRFSRYCRAVHGIRLPLSHDAHGILEWRLSGPLTSSLGLAPSSTTDSQEMRQGSGLHGSHRLRLQSSTVGGIPSLELS